MKYLLLYVTLAVLLWSAECKVCGSPTVEPISEPTGPISEPTGPISEPGPGNGPQTSVSHLPPSPSENDVIGQDIDENEVIGQAGQQHPEVFHQDLKRDIGSLFPIGGKFISDVVNKGEDFVGAFIPKLENQDIGSLFPIGGEYISDVADKWEDFVESLIPKVGKRDLRRRRDALYQTVTE